MEFEKVKSSAAVVQQLSVLNEDILLHSFEYLSIQDRSNAKLVCRTWYRVCSRKKFTDKETFHFPPFYDIRSIEKVLTGPRPKLNIKFNDRQFRPNFNSLLVNCADRIESLQFYDCVFYDTMLADIFTICKNLKELCVSGECIIFGNDSLFQSKVNFQREELTTLDLDSLHPQLSETDLSLIASTFPKLKSFKLNFGIELLTALFLFNLLANELLHIETLHIRWEIQDYQIESYYYQLSKFDLSRLKNVGITLHFKPEILNYISFRKSLRSLNIFRRQQPVDINALADFLVENVELEYLKFEWHLSDNATDFCKLFTALVKSRLKSLDIYFRRDAEIFTEVAVSMMTLSSNSTVHYLKLGVAGYKAIIDLFLKYFSEIRELDFWMGQPDLTLLNQINSTKIKMTEVTLPLRRTNSLKPLVESVEFITILRPGLFQIYQFPNLKCLCIEDFEFRLMNSAELKNYLFISKIFIKRFKEILTIACRESPNLEAVEYHCKGPWLNVDALLSFFQFCLKFRNLRYIVLSFHNIVGKFDQLKREIFNYCEQYVSIRWIWLIAGLTQHIFYLDKITQKFQYKQIDSLHNYSYKSRLKSLYSY